MTAPSGTLPRKSRPALLNFDSVAAPSTLRCSELPQVAGQSEASFLVEVCGDLDERLVARMRESIFSAATKHPACIVVDLEQVSSVDGSGLRTLIAARRRCSAGGTRFALRRPSPSVQRLLRLTHLHHVFDVDLGLDLAA